MCLRKNNSNEAIQLIKDSTTEQQVKSTPIQDKSGKCLKEENEILKQTDIVLLIFLLYNYETNGDPTVIDFGRYQMKSITLFYEKKGKQQSKH